MIYCVIPPALADDLYDRLTDYYRDDPNVKVIVDRREGPDRRTGPRPGSADRRRRRLSGTFPPIRASE
jgi:hypothetical protein